MKSIVFIFKFALLQAFVAVSLAQYVDVTISLDNPSVVVGAATTLRVYGQVAESHRASSERIFSWYLDFLNDTPGLVTIDFAAIEKPTSDKNPATSSFGTTDEANRRAIYDTFMATNVTGIGISAPIELFSVPIRAAAPGQARFRVTAGSGVSTLSDFIVAPKTGGDPYFGGIYDSANALLEITEPLLCTPPLRAAYASLGGGQNKVTLTFTPCPGRTQFVEFSDRIFPATWQTLPNGPHNSGTAADTNAVKLRFYRLRIQ